MSNDSVGIALGAMAQATAAQTAADKAVCLVATKTYNATAATVADMREYAGCVYKLHGTDVPFSGMETLLLKAAVVMAFGLVAAGGIFGWRASRAEGLFFGSLVGGGAAGVVTAFGALIFSGVQFLFS